MAGRGGRNDVSYEIQVCKNGNWVRFGVAETPEQAEKDARAALTERKYLESYKIICERRDSRSGKFNKIAFSPVLRAQLSDEADQQWQRHIEGKPPVDPKPKRKSPFRQFSWLLPVLILVIIVWVAYFALYYLRAQIFAK